MRTSVKILISLIISLAIFVGLLFLNASAYDSFVESKMYKPAVVRHINENLSDIEQAFTKWNKENTELLSNFLQEESLMAVVNQEQTQLDIDTRNSLISKMRSTVSGFIGLRIIADKYQKIHFSTFPEDILTKTDSMLSYKKYNDTGSLTAYQHIAVTDKSDIKITASAKFDMLLYCLPFYDTYDVYRGTAVFYLSGKSFLYHLVSENILTISDDLTLLSDEPHTILGILTGSQNVVSPELKEIVINDWERLPYNLRVISLEGKDNWVLVTKKSDFGYVGRLADKYIFMFSTTVKYFLMFTAFITIFLTLFLLLNIKRNRLFTAENKIQQLHLSILTNYLKGTQKENWDEIQKELEYHRHEVNTEIKKGIGKKLLKTKEKEIDEFLQKNWQEIFDLINKTFRKKAGEADSKGTSIKDVSREELVSILMESLKSQKTISEESKIGSTSPKTSIKVDEVEIVEELDEIEEVEAIEELDEVEEVTTIEDLEDVAEVEIVEELGEIEEVEAVEELDEVEEAATVEDLDEIEETETVEELDEIEETEEIQSFEDLGEEEKTEISEFFNEEESFEVPEDLDEVKEVLVEESVSERPHSKTFIEESSKRYGDLDMDAPIQRLNDLGYTISGLDFSELDVPISELEDAEAKKVEYIDGEYSPLRRVWGRYDERPVLGDLDVVGDAEPMYLTELNEEQTIINEDGVFVIRKTEPVKPEDQNFKALVDSVLK